MESLPQARLQRRRRMPCRLEDNKLKRVKRARHLQVSSPTEVNCSRVTLENSEPVSRSMTLHCNMIRSEIHETSRPSICSDSFDLARQIFGDDRSYSGATSDLPCRLRQVEHRSVSGDRRRSYNRPPHMKKGDTATARTCHLIIGRGCHRWSVARWSVTRWR